MISISENLINDYIIFVSGSLTALVPIIGITAGVFLAFTIFERVVRLILKTFKKV